MFPSWLCYYLPLPIISLYGHAVLEGVHRLSKGFAFWKIRTFVLRSLPVVYYVFVLAFQTVFDVMTITCYLSYNLAGWFQGEGTDRALFPVFSTLPPSQAIKGGTAVPGWSVNRLRVESGPTEKPSQVRTFVG